MARLVALLIALFLCGCSPDGSITTPTGPRAEAAPAYPRPEGWPDCDPRVVPEEPCIDNRPYAERNVLPARGIPYDPDRSRDERRTLLMEALSEMCLEDDDIGACDEFRKKKWVSLTKRPSPVSEPVLHLRDLYAKECEVGDAATCSALVLLLRDDFGLGSRPNDFVDDGERLWWYACAVRKDTEICDVLGEFEQDKGVARITRLQKDAEAGGLDGLLDRVRALTGEEN